MIFKNTEDYRDGGWWIVDMPRKQFETIFDQKRTVCVLNTMDRSRSLHLGYDFTDGQIFLFCNRPPYKILKIFIS